jgi:gamma-glutamylcyclotransferase (GGCT)/AIG2-like uncharacterized protein YtfP
MKRLFLVYGTLKAGHGNGEYYMGHPSTKFLGEFTTPPNYTLYDGGYPIVERQGNTSIQGELYEVSDTESIDGIFGLEGCHSQIQGHLNNTFYDFDMVDTPHGKAVMFVMDKGRSKRNHIIQSGKW